MGEVLYYVCKKCVQYFYTNSAHLNNCVFFILSKEACLYAGADWLSPSVSQRVARSFFTRDCNEAKLPQKCLKRPSETYFVP